MTKSLLPFLLISSTLASSLFAQRGLYSRDPNRVYFDNHSSCDVTLYKRTSRGSYEAQKTLAPGETASAPAVPGNFWTVATPAYYRPIDMIAVRSDRSSRGARRAIITDSKVYAIGTQRMSIPIANETGTTIDLYKVVDGELLPWSRLNRGASKSYYGYSGQTWVARSTSGRELDRFTVGRQPRRMAVHDRSDIRDGGFLGGGGGGRHDHHHDHGPADDRVTMVVSNYCAGDISLLKRTTFGSRKVGTIAAGRTGRILSEPGEVWRIEDSDTLEVLKTVTVPRGGREFAVSVGSPVRPTPRPRPRPAPTPEPVKMTTVHFDNETGGSIDIFRHKDGGWKHTKRVNRGRHWDVEAEAGSHLQVREASTGRLINTFRVPDREASFTVRDERDSNDGHDGHNHPDADETPPANGEVLRPRDVLRRLLGR